MMPLPRLIIADSEHSPDMLYATRFFAPDAFVFLQKNGRTLAMLSDLEVDRGRRDAQVDEIVAYSEIANRLPRKMQTPFYEVVAEFLREQKVRSALVPASFPHGLAQQLAKRGLKLRAADGLFWKERERKTEAELRQMRRALQITETGMARAMEVLRVTKIEGKKKLRWANQSLTSELLRAEIDAAILRVGGLPVNTIVAGGVQACDPHERGS